MPGCGRTMKHLKSDVQTVRNCKEDLLQHIQENQLYQCSYQISMCNYAVTPWRYQCSLHVSFFIQCEIKVFKWFKS